MVEVEGHSSSLKELISSESPDPLALALSLLHGSRTPVLHFMLPAHMHVVCELSDETKLSINRFGWLGMGNMP